VWWNEAIGRVEEGGWTLSGREMTEAQRKKPKNGLYRDHWEGGLVE